MDHIAVTLGIPSFDDWKASFGLSLSHMLCATYGNKSTCPIEVYLANLRGSNICKNRQGCVKYALEMNSTHVLFLDSDMAFPTHTMHQLLHHNKDIVAANYAYKKEPYMPICLDMKGKLIYTTPESKGLVKADFAGTGCMLIKTEVFKEIEQPWFGIEWLPAKQDYCSDDVFFCRKAREAGYDIWVDQDLSKEMVHLGTKDYRHEGC